MHVLLRALAFGVGATALLLAGNGCKSPASAPMPVAFSNWPAGTSPQEVGRRVASNFAVRKFEFETNPAQRQYIIYPEACTWYGALTTAWLARDRELNVLLIQKFGPFRMWERNRISQEAHVDFRVFGIVPLEIYQQNSEWQYLNIGRDLADEQWAHTTPDGITTEARYWIDDMYMITALQVQAFRATYDDRYLHRAALTMAAYLDRLQQPNGLFFHAPDSPFFWGRGNGWVAAGMAELLRSLPATEPHYARIMEGYHKMMAALLKYQGEDGLWRQLIDVPEAWPETSSTGMFAFAMITGVKNGWLDAATYGPAARKAWLGLVKQLDADANVANVCEGTNKAFMVVGADHDAQLKYYLARRRRTGDLHGQAPILWSASALMQ
jgi:rhamnogalacturonyl hydrolase YesR